jgi:SAM-dependent methyltransferase
VGEIMGSDEALAQWQTEEHVARWFSEWREPLSPDRAAAFAAILARVDGIVHLSDPSPARFVDLGSGDGPLAESMLDRYPAWRGELVDFSEPMIERGRAHLARFGERSRYVFWDMSEGSWPQELHGPFDAVVSSSAIHHLSDARRDWLFAEIRTRLRPGGVFANYDFHRAASVVVDEATDDHLRTCSTIESALRLMAEAGFDDVRVDARTPYEIPVYELAVVSGRTRG